jgi:hypothetical protein
MDYEKLLSIGIQKRNKEIAETWEQLAFKYANGVFDGEAYRLWVKNQVNRKGLVYKQVSTSNDTITGNDETQNKYNESVEIHKDGTQSSNKLVRMTIEDSKNPNFLLKAHGYDIESWELISAKSNIWNVYSKSDGISTLYSSKISVKPKTSTFSFDKLIEEIRKETPLYIKNRIENAFSSKRLLEIPFFDSHFGVSDYEYYKETQNETIELITSKKWDEILFIIGQDMLHNDNFRGQTSSGTMIDKVDMISAWSNAKRFFYPLIKEAIDNSNKVKIIYSKGNHDEAMSWAFVQLIKEKFPDVEFDDSFQERKCHTYGEVFIGVTHGDKARKNLHNLFPIEFPLEWAKAKTRELHCGHLHVEDAKDVFGMMVRTLSTKNKTDKWHQDNGFVGAHKRFMLFEYNEKELKNIHYV